MLFICTFRGSLRAIYGSNGDTGNAVHGSDSAAQAIQEIKFFFPNLQLADASQSAATAQVLILQLMMSLTCNHQSHVIHDSLTCNHQSHVIHNKTSMVSCLQWYTPSCFMLHVLSP